MQNTLEEKLNNLIKKQKNFDIFNDEYRKGFCFYCFANQDEDYNALMNLINHNIEDFDKLFINAFKTITSNELNAIMNDIESIEDEQSKINKKEFVSPIINLLRERLKVSSLHEYIENYSYNLIQELIMPYAEDFPNVMNNEYIKKFEPLYSTVKILFEDYLNRTKPLINFEEIENVKKQLLDIYFPNVYIDKYDLLKFSNFHDLYVSYKEGSHIADYGKQKYFHNQHIPTIIFEVIKNLLEKKYIHELSFLVTHISNNVLCLEEKEYGKSFSYDLKTLPEISSFYDQKLMDNKLIVKKQIKNSKISLTFETLKDDFISQDNYVLTNLIHLEIDTIENKEFITHLDHEFIFYTLDEYEKKLNKYSYKGFKKLKTFKINNSQIPLEYNYKNTPILIYFVMELLDNKELVIEYFSKILKNKIV